MSPSTQALTRRNLTTLLKAIQEIKQTRVAEMSDISETALSRMHVPQGKDDRSELERLCAVASACNLVFMPRTYRGVDPDRLRALAILARDSIEHEARSIDLDGADSGMGGL